MASQPNSLEGLGVDAVAYVRELHTALTRYGVEHRAAVAQISWLAACSARCAGTNTANWPVWGFSMPSARQLRDVLVCWWSVDLANSRLEYRRLLWDRGATPLVARDYQPVLLTRLQADLCRYGDSAVWYDIPQPSWRSLDELYAVRELFQSCYTNSLMVQQLDWLLLHLPRAVECAVDCESRMVAGPEMDKRQRLFAGIRAKYWGLTTTTT